MHDERTNARWFFISFPHWQKRTFRKHDFSVDDTIFGSLRSRMLHPLISNSICNGQIRGAGSQIQVDDDRRCTRPVVAHDVTKEPRAVLLFREVTHQVPSRRCSGMIFGTDGIRMHLDPSEKVSRGKCMTVPRRFQRNAHGRGARADCIDRYGATNHCRVSRCFERVAPMQPTRIAPDERHVAIGA